MTDISDYNRFVSGRREKCKSCGSSDTSCLEISIGLNYKDLTMNREYLELMREWIRAEVEYVLAFKGIEMVDRGRVAFKESMIADELFEKLVRPTDEPT